MTKEQWENTIDAAMLPTEEEGQIVFMCKGNQYRLLTEEQYKKVREEAKEETLQALHALFCIIAERTSDGKMKELCETMVGLNYAGVVQKIMSYKEDTKQDLTTNNKEV